ncbi:ribulose-bisphosphate carboxylase large subunit [Patescibacteria group bacterium]|nr:ribulose-bisphosphate carboxylase large subunit [Patescibacteria group bacterium]MBU4511708.1 ribulose-bisphosphate carboxylase large subunit [Patescibacteria group bacterium]MCG2692957.1 RuBisCO large subunit C-terminal-like domain-containing protein [Candidatus Parcubacteria bacterium]
MHSINRTKNYYLHLGTHPDPKKHLIVTYKVESSHSWKKVATEVAAETSIGTWTALSTLKPPVAEKLAARVFVIKKTKSCNMGQRVLKIAYPLVLFEKASIPQLLSGLAGNVFSLKMIPNIRLEDIEFPDAYIKHFQGPAFGKRGVCQALGIKKRPIVAAIMKPKLGLSATENAKLAYELWKNGMDLIKDDENLTDLDFNQFKFRVEKTLYLRNKAEKELGLNKMNGSSRFYKKFLENPNPQGKLASKHKMYVFNITAVPDIMMERARLVKKAGGKCVMVDIVSVGLDNVQMLRKANLGLIIHGHRAGHSAFTRNPKHGISMLVLAKLARLAGVDQLHTGTVVGKMADTHEQILAVNKAITEKWGCLKPTMPIASGGLHPALVPKLIKKLGKDIIINFGGGLHGHPDGSKAGARACFQAVEAVMRSVKLKKWAKTHDELWEALKLWHE